MIEFAIRRDDMDEMSQAELENRRPARDHGRFEELQDSPAALCAPWLMEQLQAAVAAHSLPVKTLPSGAGHDGLAMSAIADICMLFVRCEKGVSHNPAEAITPADADVAARVLLRFIEQFSPAGRALATETHGNTRK